MRAAPPTVWPLARRGFWRLAHAAVPALAGAALGAAMAPWPLPAAVCAAGVSTVLADRLWQRRRPAVLKWDGVQWRLEARDGLHPGQVSLIWDGGRWLMARWHDHTVRASRWLLLDRADAVSAADWHALRVALVQRPRAAPLASRAEAA